MTAPVSFDELSTTYEWVSAGIYSQNRAYVSRVTGKIHWVSEPDLDDEEIPEDIEDGTVYVAVPHKKDLELGLRTLALRFTKENLPGSYETVCECFSRKGANARFQSFLERAGQLQAWYAYRDAAEERALREWAAETGLQLTKQVG